MVLLPNPVNIEHAPTRIIIEVSESRIVQNIEDVIQTFRSYVEERRTLEIPRFRREELDYAIRYTPMEHSAFGIVCFTRAGEDDIEGFIESQISYFAQVGIDFEWKVYDFDQPPDLKQRLLDWVFEKRNFEAFMVCDLSRFHEKKIGRGKTENVCRVEDLKNLQDIVKFQERTYEMRFPGLLEQLQSADTAVFAAYNNESLIGTGWIVYPKDSKFAEIHGGLVHPEFRGRRLYSATLQLRFRDAVSRGYRYVAVDAALMSRPILEKRGFQRLCWTYPHDEEKAQQSCRDEHVPRRRMKISCSLFTAEPSEVPACRGSLHSP